MTRTAVLLSLMLSGDAAAQRRLFERHRSVLTVQASRHPAMRLLRRHFQPEDVVGEVYLRALSSGSLLRFEDRGPGSLDGYLITLLERVLADACRRVGATKRGANATRVDCDLVDMSELQSGNPTPSGLARASELHELCRRHLGEREWEAWRLAEYEGLNRVETAKRMGITDAAVRGLLLRARVKLTKLLAPDRDA